MLNYSTLAIILRGKIDIGLRMQCKYINEFCFKNNTHNKQK